MLCFSEDAENAGSTIKIHTSVKGSEWQQFCQTAAFLTAARLWLQSMGLLRLRRAELENFRYGLRADLRRILVSVCCVAFSSR